MISNSSSILLTVSTTAIFITWLVRGSRITVRSHPIVSEEAKKDAKSIWPKVRAEYELTNTEDVKLMPLRSTRVKKNLTLLSSWKPRPHTKRQSGWVSNMHATFWTRVLRRIILGWLQLISMMAWTWGLFKAILVC